MTDIEVQQLMEALRKDFRDSLASFREDVKDDLKRIEGQLTAQSDIYMDKQDINRWFDVQGREIKDIKRRVDVVEKGQQSLSASLSENSRRWPTSAIATVTFLITAGLTELGYIVAHVWN